MTEDETISLGLASKALLESDTYVAAMNAMSNHHIAAICGSRPNETEPREQSYRAIRAIQEIHDTLSQWVTAMENVEEARNIRELSDEETTPETVEENPN